MKIVTAGQRGSGATGDEIRKMRDNKRRLFSYSLIILFSCAIGGKAAAAKLCRLGPFSTHWPYDVENNAEPSGGTIDENAAVTWKIFHTSDRNAQPALQGIHFCSNGPTYYTNENPFKPDAAAGNYCYCRRTYAKGEKNLGNWVYMGTPGGAGKCTIYCASACGTSGNPSWMGGLI